MRTRRKRKLSVASLAPPEAAIGIEDLQYARRFEKLTPYNAITPLSGGGEAFPAMLSAIDSAQLHVHLETYILRSDRTGRRFGEALARKARQGVTVRLLFDSLGSLGLSLDYLETLREAGVEILEFHPVAPWRRRFSLSRRDHRKILVVDDRVGFTGGMNIADDYASEADGGGGWHDVHCKVVGPAVLELANVFRRSWIFGGGRPFPVPRQLMALPSSPGGTSMARVIDNKIIRHRFRMRRAYLHAINRAQRSIDLMNAYFVPDRGIRHALRRAVERGVQVRIILPSKSDVKLVKWASERLYQWFLKRGVRIFEWQDRMMHAKTAVIDGVWATIGSYNLDNISLRYNLEVAIVAIGRDFGAEMARRFESDLRHCKEITLEEWKRRPFWRRWLEWLAFRLRRWL